MKESFKTIFEKGSPGRGTRYVPDCDLTEEDLNEYFGEGLLRKEGPGLPEVSEHEAVRHYTGLSERNHGVDSGFYPLGSCTMKYNPKVNEDIAGMRGFSGVHPYQQPDTVQGCLQVIYELDRMLSEITGMDRFTMQPAAGAHGELTGLFIIRAYHSRRGDSKRKRIIVPDTAHGTNPASASVAGFEVVEVKSDSRGNIDSSSLREVMDQTVAGLMMTNPNTLGLFEENIEEVSHIAHDAGALLYYDGANANAVMGLCRPGDMGFDIVHLNLHKTFSTPHGGGGPGSGPVGVKKNLEGFLPVPVVEKENGCYLLEYDRPHSIGRVRAFYGNFLVALKAYAYISAMGPEGLKSVSQTAVLNANYLVNRLKDTYRLPFDRTCMHEFVLSADRQKENGISAMDIAKRLMDFGFHPPTVYFPLIVKEAMMIEPTETETPETLERFARVLVAIAHEAKQNPDIVKSAPHYTPVSRPDEAMAARKPVLRWEEDKKG